MISIILFFYSQSISFSLSQSRYSNNIYHSLRASITIHSCFPHSQRLIFLLLLRNQKPLNIDEKEKREIRQLDPWHSPTYSLLSSYFSEKKFFSSFPKASSSTQTPNYVFSTYSIIISPLLALNSSSPCQVSFFFDYKPPHHSLS